jgi:hypothetical protein
MPATCVSHEESDVEAIKQKNEKYLEVRKHKFFFVYLTKL